MSKELLADVVNKQQIKIWAEETRAMEAKLIKLQSDLKASREREQKLRDALGCLKVDIHYHYTVCGIDDVSEDKIIDDIDEALS